jgi:hypothetical protein
MTMKFINVSGSLFGEAPSHNADLGRLGPVEKQGTLSLHERPREALRS